MECPTSETALKQDAVSPSSIITTLLQNISDLLVACLEKKKIAIMIGMSNDPHITLIISGMRADMMVVT